MWLAWVVGLGIVFVSAMQYFIGVIEYRSWLRRMAQHPQFGEIVRDLLSSDGRPAKGYTPWVPPSIDWQQVVVQALATPRSLGSADSTPLHTPRADRTPASDAPPMLHAGTPAGTHEESARPGRASCSAAVSPILSRVLAGGASPGSGGAGSVDQRSLPAHTSLGPAGGSAGSTPRQQRRKEGQEGREGKKAPRGGKAKGAGSESKVGASVGVTGMRCDVGMRCLAVLGSHRRCRGCTQTSGCGTTSGAVLPLPGDHRMITILVNAKRPGLSRTIAGAVLLLPLHVVLSCLWVSIS